MITNALIIAATLGLILVIIRIGNKSVKEDNMDGAEHHPCYKAAEETEDMMHPSHLHE